MLNARTLALAVFALVCTQACVSKGRYKEDTDALQTKLDDATKAHDDCETQLASSNKTGSALKTSLSDMQKAMDEMKARQAEEKKRLEEFADLTRRFKKLTDSGALSVKIIDGKMVVSLGSDVLFPAGSAKLSKQGQKAIKEVAAQLGAIPDKRYQVEGHTDNQPISTPTFPSNWELASARAVSVVKTMIDNGMAADRVSAASYADTKPVQSNDTVEGRAANRRVAIVVVPDLSSLPGYDELQKMSQ